MLKIVYIYHDSRIFNLVSSYFTYIVGIHSNLHWNVWDQMKFFNDTEARKQCLQAR